MKNLTTNLKAHLIMVGGLTTIIAVAVFISLFPTVSMWFLLAGFCAFSYWMFYSIVKDILND